MFAQVGCRGSFFEQYIEMKAGRMPEALEMLWMSCLDSKLSGEKPDLVKSMHRGKTNNLVHVLSVFKFGLY